jgi:VCBS repeat-containing protein
VNIGIKEKDMDHSMLIMGNVLDNDTDVDSAHSDLTVTTASADPIVGAYGSLIMNADGSYSYQIDDSNTAVLALQTGQSVQEVFNYTMSDNHPTDPKSSSSTLTITINGTNDAPVAVADVQSVDEGNESTITPTLTGNVLSNDTDADSPAEDFTVTSETTDPIIGLYGTLTMGLNGDYTYVLDNANPDVDALNVGDSLQDVFSYTMSDNDAVDPKSATSTLTITINGTNDAPVAVADVMAGDKGLEAVPSAPIVGNVLVNDTDVDSVQADFTVTSASVDPIVGTYGSLILNADGSYTYAIDDANPAVDALHVGESLQDVFNYTMSDNNPTEPKTSNSTLTITINGVNNAPVAVADTNAGNEGNETIPSEPVTGNVLSNDTDVDNLSSGFTVTTASVDPIVGNYGSLMLNANGSYSYVIDDANPVVDALNVGQSVQDVFNYTMSDNDAIDPKTASSTLTITINGTNDKPVAVASLNAGNEGNETVPSVPVVGNVLDNVTDVDNARADWTITSPTVDPLVGAYGTLTLNIDGSYSYVIDDANIAVNALNTGGSVIDIFNYTMSDNNPTNPKSVSSTLTIRIDGTNDAPTANADTKFRNQGSDGQSSVPIFGNVLDNDRDPDTSNGDFTVTSASGGDIAGTYGVLSLNPDGTYTYVINDANSAVQALNVGDVLNDAFNYTMSDNHPTDPKFSSSILTIVIVGTNSAPLAVADVNDITEGNETVPSVPVVGNVLNNDTDIDSPQGGFIVTTASNDPIVGTYGSLLLHEDGSYTYTLDDANTTVDALNVGQILEDVFNYTMSDNNASDPKTSSSTLTITIHGTNDAPVAVTDVNSGNEGNETVPSVPVVGNVLDNDTDVDSAQSAFTVTSETVDPMVGSYGTLTMSTNGDYSYVIDDANPTVDALNVGDSLVDTFDYTMSDNNPTNPKSSSSTLTITINGVNDGPIAVADVNSGNQGQETVVPLPDAEEPIVDDVVPVPSDAEEPIVDDVVPVPSDAEEPIVDDVVPVPSDAEEPIVDDVVPVPSDSEEPIVDDVVPVPSDAEEPIVDDVVPVPSDSEQPVANDVIEEANLNENNVDSSAASNTQETLNMQDVLADTASTGVLNVNDVLSDGSNANILAFAAESASSEVPSTPVAVVPVEGLGLPVLFVQYMDAF